MNPTNSSDDNAQSATGKNERIGGDLVLETIQALGGRHVVGLPGQHALGLFDAIRRSDLHYLSSRVENNAGFMADGLARATGTVAPLFLSAGPGALTSLAALQEAAASSIPVLAVAAQIPVRGLGGGRHGYLHELPDQAASFKGVVKDTFTVRHVSQIVPAVIEAWQHALDAPAGPVLLELPQDVLLERIDEDLFPVPTPMLVHGKTPRISQPLIERAAEILASAARPVIYAGGGVRAAAATTELLQLAERLAAPVATTFGGKEVFPWEHPLSLQSWAEDLHTTEFLEDADVLLVVGSGLGELSSNYFTLDPRGTVIHIDADLGQLTANYRGMGIHADARDALSGILAALPEGDASEEKFALSAARAAEVRDKVAARLAAQPLEKEMKLIAELRAAVPAHTDTFWDMTVLAYWAWSAWNPQQGISASAQGSGGLGYGLPAAIGSALAAHTDGGSSKLAVSGDGGSLYGIAELATLAQHNLDVTWLIIDDGGYGILREYMVAEFGAATATELTRPDYVALAKSFGISARKVSIEDAPAAVAEGLAAGGPQLVLVETKLELFAPTHLDRPAAHEK
ncbi:thiamine pyrophosphate-binding protein [Salinibacterium sp. TMP30]|uniref:thiamine pyrophosphate-binding protein n=1 Tax=Salinibacterium sp. TMP30 TaxID=3138237 RepID=UPI0031395619